MRKLGVIAIVVIGLLALLQGWTWISYSITAIRADGTPQAFVLSLLPLIGCLVLGAFLISNRELLADRWFQDADIGISLDAVSLLRLGLIIIGVNLIVDAVPSVLKSVSDLIIQGAQGKFNAETLAWPNVGWGFLQGLVLQLIQLGIGLLLISHSQSLAAYLWLGRTVVEPEAPTLPQCPACGTPFDPNDYQEGTSIARCSACQAPLDLGRP
ncbi:MAG TPA: hypothetical protein VMC85_21485 [Desulfomonilaceae bacterium]|nr:hypothetical protein [Desulfomonilaceae bacterium]